MNLGNVSQGNPSNDRRQMPAADLIWLSIYSPFPVSSALLAGTGIWIANISCQFIFISQCLVSASKNTPTTLFKSSKDHTWRVPAMSLLPFQGHKWRYGCSPLTGCPEKSTQHTKEPSRICHWGVFQKSRNKTDAPLKKGATLIRMWYGHKAKPPVFDNIHGGKPQKRFTFFETTKLSLKFSLAYNCE